MADLDILGFNSYETRVLNELLKGEIFTVKELYERTKIPKNKIYETLERLIEKDIVADEKGKPRRFFIVNDGILDMMIKNKADELENLKQNIEDLRESKEQIHPSVLSIIEGSDEIHKLIEYSNRSIKQEILSCSRLTKMYHSCFSTLREAIKRGVRARFVAIDNGKNSKILKAYKSIGVDLRIYQGKGVFPKIGLFDKKYARITIARPDVGSRKHYKTIWAKSEILYAILANHFETIWEQSKDF